jgi:uncharacterized iron-regulated protein
VVVGEAEVIFLGEVHDNPEHHAVQANWVAEIAPAALVVEMITEEAANGMPDSLRGDRMAMELALDWDSSGWPDFSLYWPIFEAAAGARLYGAGVPRSQARAALARGPAESFGADAARFGLDQPLPEAERAEREAFQAAAHCHALPPEMLPGMVDVQRLRDAVLARAALRALEETGGPVVVIAGNGHVRKDIGSPAFLEHARPGTRIFAIGQSETGAGIDGSFDLVLPAPPVTREDPCASLR